MRPHILGLVHAVFLSGAISEQAAGHDSGSGVSSLDTSSVSTTSGSIHVSTAVASSSTNASTGSTGAASSESTASAYTYTTAYTPYSSFGLRPAHTSPADPWSRLRDQCPIYGAPAPAAPADYAVPLIIAPTPLLEIILPDELESFEEWKRRQEAAAEAELPSPRPDDEQGRGSSKEKNKSTETIGGGAPLAPEPDGNSTAETPPPPSIGKGGGAGHRYNYASPDCSARVLSSSPLTQHASSLLHKSRDRYMLTPCRADEHWVIIELCDEIRVEAIELAVWEFFSGIVRGVTVSVGDEASSASASWTQVGEFVGKNVRGAQTFTLPEPTSFHRFLRLDFPSFYGSEYYCPVSQLKVYGMNQMEAFKMEQRRAAEASGAKTREREELEREKEREKEKEREREKEADRQREKEREAAEAAAREQQRVDDERRERELCELEKLVQEQARRAGILLEASECPPTDPSIRNAPPPAETAAASNAAAASNLDTTLANTDATTATASPATVNTGAGGGNSTDANASTSTSASSTYSVAGAARTDSSESIYAFIIRRLNALEGNSTLVARYIDEQAKALRAALTRAESRWEMSLLLATKEYEKRFESERMRQEDRLGHIISQMEAMRNALELERRVTESQLRVLTDELGFERRKSLAQLIVLVVAIILGVLSRGNAIESLLGALAVEGRRRHTRVRTTTSTTPNKHQKRLSTGPLAGLLIDVASPSTSTTNPSTPTAAHQSTTLQPRLSSGKAPRRPVTPNSNLRRRTPASRSFSAEPGTLPLDHEADNFVSPRRNAVLSQRRKLARSAHLHPIRRRGDESSEAETRASAPVSPQDAFRPLSLASLSPSPAAAAAAVAAVKSGETVAPEEPDDGGSAPDSAADSASEVEDTVRHRMFRSSSASSSAGNSSGMAGPGGFKFGRRLLEKFAEIANEEEQLREEEEDKRSIRSGMSGRSSRSVKRFQRREGDKAKDKGKGKEKERVRISQAEEPPRAPTSARALFWEREVREKRQSL